MNRKQRRAAGRINGPVIICKTEILDTVLAQLRTDACPDCDADTHLRTDNDGMRHLEVLHDDTCPVWQAMQREEGR